MVVLPPDLCRPSSRSVTCGVPDGVLAGRGVGAGVRVGGTAVAVAVAIGGTGVSVGAAVAVAGTDVIVGDARLAVGGKGVALGSGVLLATCCAAAVAAVGG